MPVRDDNTSFSNEFTTESSASSFHNDSSMMLMPGSPSLMPLTNQTSYTSSMPSLATGSDASASQLQFPEYLHTEVDGTARQQDLSDPNVSFSSFHTNLPIPPTTRKRKRAKSAVKQGGRVTGVPSTDLQTKIRIIELAEANDYDPSSSPNEGKLSGAEIASRFKVNKSTVSRILKRKEEWKRAFYQDRLAGTSKHIRKTSKYDQLNKLVENWFDMEKRRQGNVTDASIREKAKEYAADLALTEFRASNGWVRCLRNRKENRAVLPDVGESAQAKEEKKRKDMAIQRIQKLLPTGPKELPDLLKDIAVYVENSDQGWEVGDPRQVALELRKQASNLIQAGIGRSAVRDETVL